MTGDDNAVGVPLIRDQECSRDSLEDHHKDLVVEARNSTSPSAFIWALTFIAGISGILFGYE